MTTAQIPECLRNFVFEKSFPPTFTAGPGSDILGSNLAISLGAALYLNPESGKDARLWFAALWANEIEWLVSPEHAADFLDNGNEIAWISAAFGLLDCSPSLTDWAYAAVGAQKVRQSDEQY
jgi:hypothetical protein